MLSAVIATAVLSVAASSTKAPSLRHGVVDRAKLENALRAIPVDGRLGVCVGRVADKPMCLRGEERFSLQSVMKLLVAIATLDAVDAGRMKLDGPVTIRQSDFSVFVQPLSELVGPDGWTTTIGDLVHRAVTQSDNAAVDVLIAKLGGVATVQAAG